MLLNDTKITGIKETFSMLMNDKCGYSFFFKRIIAEILWRRNEKEERLFEKNITVDIDKALRKRLHYSEDSCFMEARVKAEYITGEVDFNNYFSAINYYFYYFIYLYKIFVKSTLNAFWNNLT
jgi:hypothetical protein